VGLLEETRGGSRFRYDDEWLGRPEARAISPTLPLRSEPYESEGLHPFFDNLLPEGWLLDLKGQRLKLDASDAFGMLLASGEDLIGAVDVQPERA
jgi:serine/threonine-protein kinase HipA